MLVDFIFAVLTIITINFLLRHWIIFLKKNKIVDANPKDDISRKKILKKNVARGMGPIILLGIIGSILYTMPIDTGTTIPMIGSLVIITTIGFLDDLYRINSQLKLVVQFLAASVFAMYGFHIGAISNLSGGSFEILPAFGMLMTVLWLVLLTNSINLLDGIDGLAISITIITALTIAVREIISGGVNPINQLAFLSFNFVLICAVALFYNRMPAKIHLGDSGSYLLGFYLGILAVLSGVKLATIVLVCLLPLVDIFWVIIARLRAKRSPFSPDRLHLHLVLEDIGYSHKDIVYFYLLLSITMGVLSLLLGTRLKIIFIIICGLLFSYLIHYCREQKSN